MSIADFMNTSKSLTRIKLKGGQTQGRICLPGRERSNYQLAPGSRPGQEYSRAYQEEDDRNYEAPEPVATTSALPPELASLEGPDYLNQIETATSAGTMPNMADLNLEELTQIYDNYSFNTPAVVVDLPVMEYKDEILSRIMSTDILIITGATGCGKTTQVPQFILDYHAEKRIHCNIIVTQPRKIAAISVAKRVSEERGWDVGTLVGYQVGLDKTASSDTRLLYCTTGVLLQKLIACKSFEPYTHIILDEVHERDEEMDFTMLVVRYFYRRQTYPVKIILMSATIDTTRYSKYFSLKVRGELLSAPVYNLPDKKNHELNIFYLESLTKLFGGCNIEVYKDEPGISTQMFSLVVTLIEFLDELETKEKITNKKKGSEKGSVLVFLPGIREIEYLYERLRTKMEENVEKFKYWLCPLHSSITSEEQLKVFHRPPLGARKIILSTNIAESSITVADIKYVIDFCLTKVLVCDEQTNFSSLQLTWASKNSLTQRAGRAGRVMDGRVYRLVSMELYKSLSEESSPELCRCPLAQVVLKTKMLDLGEPKAILALALDPPDLYKVQQTILILKELGALLLTSNGYLTPDDGDITYIGKLMAALPLDVRITKMIFLGHMFGVLEETIIMGCAMSVKNVFREPFKEQLQIYNSKLTWADSSCSDLIAFLQAYQVWRAETSLGKFQRSKGNAETWARRCYIDLKGLQELSRLEQEIKTRLKGFKIEIVGGARVVKWSEVEKPLILKVAIAGAFYPNYFTRSARAGQIDEREAVKILDGKDPYTTVYLKNMPQPAAFYTSQVRQAFAPVSNQIKLSTNGSGKLFVEFPNCVDSSVSQVGSGKNLEGDIPGKIAMPVYRAIKLRHLKVPITIHVLRPEEANKRMANLRALSENASSEQPLNRHLPVINQNIFEIIITHVENAGHFWCQNASGEEDNRMVAIQDLLQRKSDLVPLSAPPTIGQLLAAPFWDGGSLLYYRARVKAKVAEDRYEIYFVDYGNTVVIPMSDLRDFGHRLPHERECLLTPDAAMECVLAEVQPSLIRNQKGKWMPEATQKLRNIQQYSGLVIADVYSVVNGVLHVDLYLTANARKGVDKTLNQILIDEGFAQKSEESYLSKMNHDIRLRYMEMSAERQQAQLYDNSQLDQSKSLDMDVQQPRSSECRDICRLRGPESPLEMSIHSITRASSGKKVVIDWASVNSVMLDADPQDPHERLLVAGTVSINSTNNQLNLRHTTMMPNIHGLSAILCMLFAPKIELRTNKKRTRLTGALCGLGVDHEGLPLHPANDIEVTFDCEIGLEDIELINKIRFWMNSRLCSTQIANIEDIALPDILHYQTKVAEALSQLLGKQRESVHIIYNNEPYTWEKLPKSEMLSPARFESDVRCINPVFDLHWGVNIDENDSEEVEEFLNHLARLSSYLEVGAVVKDVRCYLCDVEVETAPLLRLHLETTQHKELAEKIQKRAKELKLI